MMKRKNLYALFSCLFLSGCGMIDYHPYDVRISGETEVNAHNMERIEANCQGKTTIRFVKKMATHNDGMTKRKIL